MIQAFQLTRRYGSFTAVKDVSFEIPQGQVIGLLGPNGAGKTTLMKILTGYHQPSEGRASIGGFDLSTQTEEAQALLGYLPESAPLYGDQTVLEYLTMMAGLRGLTFGTERRSEVLEKTGLTEVPNKLIGHLSKGYRQRVGLAQAILHDPKVLILDEPTTGLDPNQILEFRDLVRALGSEKTVILSTHILQEVEAVCQRVLIMAQGRIQAEGAVAEIGARLRQGRTLIRASFKGRPARDLLSDLSRLPHQVGAPVLLSGEGPERIELTFGPGVDGGELLFDWAKDQGLKLTSLIPQHLSLEDVFAELTREQKTEEVSS